MADAQQDKINFDVMFATHDAFRRDLERLEAAAVAGKTDTPEVRAGWENFKHQLHIHHTVEDERLWPTVQSKVGDKPEPNELLREMEAEHGQLDPVLTAVDEALAAKSPDLIEKIKELGAVLGFHMKHEEESALPLIQETCTNADWTNFAKGMAQAQGIKGAAVYIPWILDSISAADRQKFLVNMPPPARALNKLFWESRYHKKQLWKF
ncbi:hemerythrin domain-containing protein [Streptomyces sp. NBC_01803]|uniref:hemerythrin domain-containing protein n=1 Tax=Streptomyces sp. NBC_01803 TaxID=2975946 RepID=UPI002DD905A2|nr:hemerythrin domain-containing protein [Streptomyces sp. NBC_01803]WSA47019.1 hemerythrin domain-containing protein [Streptomyces sp. NBC_01803]